MTTVNISLHKAAAEGDVNLLQRELKAIPKVAPVQYFLEEEEIAYLKLQNITDLFLLNSPFDGRGLLPVHCAALNGQIEALKFLSDQIALHHGNWGHWTVFHFAVLRESFKNSQLIRYLFVHYPKFFEMRNFAGRTPLDVAIERKKKTNAALLVSLDNSVLSKKNWYKLTPVEFVDRLFPGEAWDGFSKIASETPLHFVLSSHFDEKSSDFKLKILSTQIDQPKAWSWLTKPVGTDSLWDCALQINKDESFFPEEETLLKNYGLECEGFTLWKKFVEEKWFYLVFLLASALEKSAVALSDKNLFEKVSGSENSLLHFSILKKRHKMIPVLLEKAPRLIHQKNKDGDNPLVLSVKTNNFSGFCDLVAPFLKGGFRDAESRETLYDMAVAILSDPSTWHWFSEFKKYFKEVRKVFNVMHKGGFLHACVQYGCLEWLTYALTFYAPYEVWYEIDAGGNTVAHSAVSENQFEIVVRLFEYDPGLFVVKNKQDEEPVISALKASRFSIIHYLYQNANLDLREKARDALSRLIQKSRDPEKSLYENLSTRLDLAFPKQVASRETVRYERIRYLVFQGGGSKGYAYIGALQTIQEQWAKSMGDTNETFLDGVLGVGGASAGSITASLLASGWDGDKLEQRLKEFDGMTFMDGDARILIENYKRYSRTQDVMSTQGVNDSFLYALNIVGSALFSVLSQLQGVGTALGVSPMVIGVSNVLSFLFGKLSETKWVTDLVGRLKENAALLSFYSASGKFRKGASDFLGNLFQNGGIFPGEAFYQWMDKNFREGIVQTLIRVCELKSITEYLGIVSWIKEFHLESLFDVAKLSNIHSEDMGFILESTLNPWITFSEFEKLKTVVNRCLSKVVFKDLRVVAFNVYSGKSEEFYFEKTPDVIITDAIRASMSIPILFQPFVIREKKDGLIGAHQFFVINEKEEPVCYLDGGVGNNFPIGLFDQEEISSDVGLQSPFFRSDVLGFRLLAKEKVDYYTSGYVAPESGLPIGEEKKNEGGERNVGKEVLFALIGFLMEDQYEWSHEMNPFDRARSIYISTCGISLIDFDLTQEQKEQLKSAGSAAVLNQFEPVCHMPTPSVPREMERYVKALLSNFNYLILPSRVGIDCFRVVLNRLSPNLILDLYRPFLGIPGSDLVAMNDYYQRMGMDFDNDALFHAVFSKVIGDGQCDFFSLLLKCPWKFECSEGGKESLLDIAVKSNVELRGFFCLSLLARSYYQTSRPNVVKEECESWLKDQRNGGHKEFKNFRKALEDFSKKNPGPVIPRNIEVDVKEITEVSERQGQFTSLVLQCETLSLDLLLKTLESLTKKPALLVFSDVRQMRATAFASLLLLPLNQLIKSSESNLNSVYKAVKEYKDEIREIFNSDFSKWLDSKNDKSPLLDTVKLLYSPSETLSFFLDVSEDAYWLQKAWKAPISGILERAIGQKKDFGGVCSIERLRKRLENDYRDVTFSDLSCDLIIPVSGLKPSSSGRLQLSQKIFSKKETPTASVVDVICASLSVFPIFKPTTIRLKLKVSPSQWAIYPEQFLAPLSSNHYPWSIEHDLTSPDFANQQLGIRVLGTLKESRFQNHKVSEALSTIAAYYYYHQMTPFLYRFKAELNTITLHSSAQSGGWALMVNKDDEKEEVKEHTAVLAVDQFRVRHQEYAGILDQRTRLSFALQKLHAAEENALRISWNSLNLTKFGVEILGMKLSVTPYFLFMLSTRGENGIREGASLQSVGVNLQVIDDSSRNALHYAIGWRGSEDPLLPAIEEVKNDGDSTTADCFRNLLAMGVGCYLRIGRDQLSLLDCIAYRIKQERDASRDQAASLLVHCAVALIEQRNDMCCKPDSKRLLLEEIGNTVPSVSTHLLSLFGNNAQEPGDAPIASSGVRRPYSFQ